MELEKLIVINLNSKPVCDEMVDELYHEIARILNRNGEILINKVPANQVQTLARAILSYAPLATEIDSKRLRLKQAATGCIFTELKTAHISAVDKMNITVEPF